MDWKRKSVLVTGGTGFLGSRIVSILKKRGVEKIIIPNSKDCDLRLKENCKKISFELHKQFIKRCNPEKNDILYTKGGTTGIARVNNFDVKFSVWVHVAVLKLVDNVRPFFVQHTLNSPFCYAQSQNILMG